MVNEYSHSAFTYACDWLWYDRPAISVLSCDRPEPPKEKACEALSRFATGYKVSRNFKIIDEDPRLAHAWSAMQKIQRPKDEEEARVRVRELVDLLSGFYGNEPWSAASKFLWIRFQSPIIIYDSLSWKWMNAPGRQKCKSFEDFCDAWRHEFLNRREKIREACEGLLEVRSYLPPTSNSEGEFAAIPEAEFEVAVRSEWFMERVFDHFMLNEESYSRIGTAGAK
jgi:hypothetical protein